MEWLQSGKKKIHRREREKKRGHLAGDIDGAAHNGFRKPFFLFFSLSLR